MKHIYTFRQVLFASLLFLTHMATGQAGVLDNTLIVGTGFNFAAEASALDGSGNLYVGGRFTSYNGTTNVNRIVRLTSTGSIDGSFNTGTGANGNVFALALQPSDGKVLIGGEFLQYRGAGRVRVARINTDGSLDAGFTVGTGAEGTGVAVNAIAVQSDNQILIAGSFTNYNGAAPARVGIARLNIDGTLDPSFNTGTGPNGNVKGIAIQSDGKIIIVGDFTSYNGNPAVRVARLEANGNFDASFNPLGAGAVGGIVNAVTLAGSDKLLIAGNFTTYNGTGRNRVAVLNSDGTLDGGFAPGTGLNIVANAVRLTSDGKYLVGGGFTTYNAIARQGIVRINTTGTIDNTFLPNPGTNNPVNSIQVQADGKTIIAGAFATYNGTSSPGLARICNILTPVMTAQIATITAVSATNNLATGGSCTILAKVVPNGGTPVSGDVSVNLTLDGTAQFIGNIPFVRRRYEINPGAGSTARVTLYYTQADFDDFNTKYNGDDLPYNGADVEGNKANIRFTKFSGTSTGGTGNPADFVPGVQTLIDPVDSDIIWNATTNAWEVTFDVSGFSGFFMQTNPLLLLPVNLKTFTAAAVQGGAKLNWTTASEQNSSHFVVERSVDGTNYRSAGRVNAAGNSQTTRNYSLVDDLSKVPHGGIIYYRLYMVDKDGTGLYSKVQTVKPGKSNAGAALLTNPVGAEARILYQANVGEKVTLRLLDSRGLLVSQRQEQVAAGSNQIRIATANLAKGIYMLEVTGNGERNTIRLVKE